MKRRPLSAVLARMSLGALCFSFTLGGCGATNTSRTKEVPQSAEHCDRQELGTCEQTILASVHEGRDARGWVRAYMDARGSGDPWFVLWNQALAANESKLPLVISEGGDVLAGHASTKAKLIKLDPLPSPASISTDALLVAVGEAAHLDIIVRARAVSTEVHRENPLPEVTEIFPRDPLAPFMMGLPPLVRDDHALSHLDADLELASAIRAAVDHASVFRYVEAAKEAEHIETLIRSRDPNVETTLRGRYVASLLASAGISFEATAPGATLAALGDPTLPEATTTTPYGDVLRLRETKDERIAFQKIGDRILKALHQDKQAAVRAMYAPRETCLQVSLDGFDAPDDLFLANWVGRTLQSSLASPRSSTNTTLALTDWLPRYETLVRNVDEANTTWSHAFALTQERGEIGGVSLRTTATHKRVDTLVAAHLAGLLQLVQTNPERVRLMSIVTLAYARGIIGTPALRDALVDLLRRAVETRMAHAADASALFEASAAGVLAATAYPTAIQGPVYGGLFSAFHDKLKKDFSRQTGWGVAGLFAADAVAGFLAGNPSDLGPVSREISRALEDPALPERSLGRLVAAAAQYLALGVNHELDADAVDVARWPASRKAARQALRQAVAGLNDPTAALSEALLDDVAMLGDQTMTAIATILQDKPSGGGPVCSNSNTGPSPAARRVLARVGDLRRKVLAHPALNKGGVGATRLRVAITVLSDAIDIVSRKRKDKPVTFTILFRRDTELHDVGSAVLPRRDLPVRMSIVPGSSSFRCRNSSATKAPEHPSRCSTHLLAPRRLVRARRLPILLWNLCLSTTRVRCERLANPIKLTCVCSARCSCRSSPNAPSAKTQFRLPTQVHRTWRGRYVLLNKSFAPEVVCLRIPRHTPRACVPPWLGLARIPRSPIKLCSSWMRFVSRARGNGRKRARCSRMRSRRSRQRASCCPA